jgi:DNA/RNA endonuclease YhcR with UshA esterase domain
MALDGLPKDWRVVPAIVVATLVAWGAARTWVISVAQAEVAPQKAAIEEMRPMVRSMYVACIRRGECEPEPKK